MERGSSVIGWLPWIAPLLTVALAILVSWLGAEIIRHSAVAALDGLRSAHWTERARVFTEANNTVRVFRTYLISVTTFLLLVSVPRLHPQQMLRFCAVALLLALAAGDPLAGRWLRRATQGSLAPLSRRKALRFQLVMFPSPWLLFGFAAFGPHRYDAAGWAWAGGLLGMLLFAQAGGAALLARALGILTPAADTLKQMVASVARAADVPVPQVYELKVARANAMAFPTLGWMAFTSAAIERLEPRALSAITAHELGHLRESLAIRLTRVLGGVALFFPVGLVPAFPRQPLVGFVFGTALYIFFSLGMRRLSLHLERQADKLAHHHQQDAGDYAAALERVYQLNWVGAGIVNRTHPSLYERLEQAGARPSYARPSAPARAPRLLALAFGLVCALFLTFVANPWLATLFESLPIDLGLPRTS